jgi:hypothetical protein
MQPTAAKIQRRAGNCIDRPRPAAQTVARLNQKGLDPCVLEFACGCNASGASADDDHLKIACRHGSMSPK